MSIEKNLSTLVSSALQLKEKSVCALESGGCGLRHYSVDDAALKSLVEDYVGSLYDDAEESHSNKPLHVSKNHIVSKSVLGKSHYKVTDEDHLAPVIVSSASKHFTMDAKFGDVFERMCGYIESLWGNKKNDFFNINTHEIKNELFRYMSREYIELKTLTALIFAIHKVRSDYKDQFLTRELAVKSLSDEFMFSFNAVSWFITGHPTRERIMNIPLIPRDITKFAYVRDEREMPVDEDELGDVDSETFLIPIDHYGYLETTQDGFGFLGALFLFHNAFDQPGRQKKYQEILTNNSEMWRGRDCQKSGEIRVFYLNEDLTYKTAVTDSIHGRKGWVKKHNKVDVKRLSKALNEYERLYISAGHGSAKKSFSAKETTYGRSPRKGVSKRRRGRKRR